MEAIVIERRDAPESFRDAFDECFLAAYQAAYRVLGRRADAEDVAQEALTRAYVRWNKIGEYAAPWVVRVATNLALDAVRKHARRTAATAAVTNDDSVAERLDLARAIAKLPKRQREVVALRYIADLSEADVMKLLACSAGTVKQHAHRGLNALRASGHLAKEIA